MSRRQPAAELVGSQEPTHELVAAYDWTHGHDAIELAESAGYQLDPWQQQLLIDGLGVRDGLWAAAEVSTLVSRQNGKSVDFEVVILVGLFLLDEMGILYTAHKDQTARKIFERVVKAINRTPDLRAELAPNGIRRANGERAITLRSGATCEFRTRTKEGARGTGYPRLLIDEAQEASDDELAALMPILSAHPDPQIWYAASAGTRSSTVLGRILADVEDGLERLTFHGWMGSEDDDPTDPVVWARLNPGYGRRVTHAWIAREQRRMTPGKFARERLGVGDYPKPEGEDWVIPRSAWEALEDAASQIVGAPVLVPDATPDLEWGSLGVAGRRSDGAVHLEVIRHNRGTAWMAPAIKRVKAAHGVEVMLDPQSPASFLKHELEALDVPVKHYFSAEDVKEAFSWLFRAATAARPDGQAPEVRHTGGLELTQALASAGTRKLLDKAAWRRVGEEPISPLVAANEAGYGVLLLERMQEAPPPEPQIASSGTRVPRFRRPPSTRDLSSKSF